MRVFVSLIVALWTGEAAAQALAAGAVVQPDELVTALDAPPEGALSGGGRMISMLLPGSRFVVEESRVVAIGGAQQEWLRIAPAAEADHPCAARACWALNRRLGEGGAFRRAGR